MIKRVRCVELGFAILCAVVIGFFFVALSGEISRLASHVRASMLVRCIPFASANSGIWSELETLVIDQKLSRQQTSIAIGHLVEQLGDDALVCRDPFYHDRVRDATGLLAESGALSDSEMQSIGMRIAPVTLSLSASDAHGTATLHAQVCYRGWAEPYVDCRIEISLDGVKWTPLEHAPLVYGWSGDHSFQYTVAVSDSGCLFYRMTTWIDSFGQEYIRFLIKSEGTLCH